MVQYVLELPVVGKQLLDMGSGTAVLAILAALRGAEPVLAIDNDEWAYKNAIENVAGNNTHQIEVLFGDSSLLSGRRFDVILANINRNILLGDIPVYCQCLPAGGKLVMSGFYLEDLPLIEACCHQNGLHLLSQKAENNWVAACFSK
jgi:ribosomal protein L11 methyltransferase